MAAARSDNIDVKESASSTNNAAPSSVDQTDGPSTSSNPIVAIENASGASSSIDNGKNNHLDADKNRTPSVSVPSEKILAKTNTVQPPTCKVDGAVKPVAEKGGSNSSSKREQTKSVSSDPVIVKAHYLADLIVHNAITSEKRKPKDKVDETLSRCVSNMLVKHEIKFRSMMRSLDINKETGYKTFVTIANVLFENEKKIITWSRIIALYAFGAQLAIYCQEKEYFDYSRNISSFLGQYVGDVLSPFIRQCGGWVSISI